MQRSKVKENMEVPYDGHGNQQGGTWYAKSMKPNKIFKATMKLSDYSRGRSSVKFEFVSEKGKTYEMFITDFIKLVKTHTLVEGITAEWAFVKRGANYGLVIIED